MWERLTHIGITRSDLWFIIDDFDEITENHEKCAGKKISEATFLPFRANVHDFPYSGNQFSWIGKQKMVR